MTYINRQLILQCLTELSDRRLQERLWMGLVPGRQSSLAEAVEGLFTDSGLDDSVLNGKGELTLEVSSMLRDLEQELAHVPLHGEPRSTINHPAMSRVRAIATQVLEKLRGEPSSKSAPAQPPVEEP